MANFCTNCGTKIREHDNFCTNCGAKIRKEDNFCTNCGAKIREQDNFCTNCGTKIDKSKNKTILKSVHDIIEKEKTMIEKEKEEERKKLKTIDEIFESEEIKSEIRKNNIGQMHVTSIKNSLKYKIINKREVMGEKEIKYFIKTELEKVRKEQKKTRITKDVNSAKIKRTRGGNCSLNCRHCYEEFLDSGGGIVGDFDSEGYVEYYCHLGHPISYGRFCEDYE